MRGRDVELIQEEHRQHGTFKPPVIGILVYLLVFRRQPEDNLSIAYELKRNEKSQIKSDNKFLENALDPNAKQIKTLISAQPFTNEKKEIAKSENWLFIIQEKSIPNSLREKVKVDGDDHFRLNPDAVEDVFLVFKYLIA
jgi:hypothetical protein